MPLDFLEIRNDVVKDRYGLGLWIWTDCVELLHTVAHLVYEHFNNLDIVSLVYKILLLWNESREMEKESTLMFCTRL